MAEGIVAANGINIWYETFGEPDDPALVLIMGIGLQGILWRPEFCERLAAGGRYVIRFDNREVGRSAWFGEDATYTLEDMADDVVGLLDALGIARAHVVGLSLGGAIAQFVAVRHPEHVLSLTSMMTGPYTAAETASAGLRAPALNLMELLARPDPETREGRIASIVETLRQISGGGTPFDEAELTAVVGESHDRAWRPEAIPRQAAAGGRTPSRVEALKRLAVPTLVIHGASDPLVPPDRGEATAALIPGARLLLIDGLGHDLPCSHWDQMISAIVQHTAMAGER